MKLSRTSKWMIGVGCFFVVVVAFAFWPFRFYYDSVCSQCGVIQQTTEWQLPHSQHSFFSHSAITQTPFSIYLTSSGGVGEHAHQWLFGHGGGNGIRCALGDGDSIRASVTSPDVARFLAFNRQYGNQEESGKLEKFVFDRDISRTILSLAAAVPTNGFATRAQYGTWLSEQGWLIDDALAIAKQNR